MFVSLVLKAVNYEEEEEVRTHLILNELNGPFKTI